MAATCSKDSKVAAAATSEWRGSWPWLSCRGMSTGSQGCHGNIWESIPRTSLYIHIVIYICIFVCVCVCIVSVRARCSYAMLCAAKSQRHWACGPTIKAVAKHSSSHRCVARWQPQGQQLRSSAAPQLHCCLLAPQSLATYLEWLLARILFVMFACNLHDQSTCNLLSYWGMVMCVCGCVCVPVCVCG